MPNSDQDICILIQNQRNISLNRFAAGVHYINLLGSATNPEKTYAEAFILILYNFYVEKMAKALANPRVRRWGILKGSSYSEYSMIGEVLQENGMTCFN